MRELTYTYPQWRGIWWWPRRRMVAYRKSFCFNLSNINLTCASQVPEDAGEEGKLGYTTLKRIVWHESFFKLLELAAQYSKTGYLHKCHNNIVQWLFPVILILSADYEEQ
jgi:hypothetical protein